MRLSKPAQYDARAKMAAVYQALSQPRFLMLSACHRLIQIIEPDTSISHSRARRSKGRQPMADRLADRNFAPSRK